MERKTYYNIFKVLNILLIANGALLVINTLRIVGLNILSLIPFAMAALIIYTGISGLKGNYDFCKKIAFVNLLFGVIGLFMGISLMGFITLILNIVYLVICVTLNNRY